MYQIIQVVICAQRATKQRQQQRGEWLSEHASRRRGLGNGLNEDRRSSAKNREKTSLGRGTEAGKQLVCLRNSTRPTQLQQNEACNSGKRRGQSQIARGLCPGTSVLCGGDYMSSHYFTCLGHWNVSRSDIHQFEVKL